MDVDSTAAGSLPEGIEFIRGDVAIEEDCRNAVEYARNGIRVVPVSPGRLIPCWCVPHWRLRATKQSLPIGTRLDESASRMKWRRPCCGWRMVMRPSSR